MVIRLGLFEALVEIHFVRPPHSAKDTRIWGVAKPDSDTLARLYGLVRGYPEVIGTQLPVIRAQ